MKQILRLFASVCAAGAAAAILGFGHGQQPSPKPSAAKVPYSTVAPLIKAQCLSCHNDKQHPGKVNLSSYKTLMRGGGDGPIVFPGHADESPLIKYVTGGKTPRMPYKKPALTSAQIASLKAWIIAGAKG